MRTPTKFALHAMVVSMVAALTATLAIVAPAQAREAAPAAGADPAAVAATLELAQADGAFAGAGSAAEPDDSRLPVEGPQPGDPSIEAVPAVITAAIVTCAGGAVASVGHSVISNLISSGQIGAARDLLADAIAGCVVGIVGTAAVAACRIIAPCRNAMNRLITDQVRRILDGF